MSVRRKHFALRATGDRLEALCGYVAADLGGMGDARRDRFTTTEDATTCALCVAELERSVSAVVDVAPEALARVRIGCREALVLGVADRPAFASWRSALRAYVAVKDDGAPLRSTSDVERSPGPTGTAPRGDTAQRQIERVVVVARLLHATCTPRELATVVLRIVGRREQRHPSGPRSQGGRDVRLKTSYVVRRPAEDTDYLAAGVAPGSVETTVRACGIRIEDALEARGLIATRDAWLRYTPEADMGRLRGWDEIADHLGVSTDTAQRARSWDPPIPVRSSGGILWADEAELDAWWRSEPRKASGE